MLSPTAKAPMATVERWAAVLEMEVVVVVVVVVEVILKVGPNLVGGSWRGSCHPTRTWPAHRL